MTLSPKQKESRQIKFRAWVGGEMISWKKMLANTYFADFFRLAYMTNPPRPVAELMQFTGLTDKNGKEIYEGDIMKTDYGKVGVVIYHEERASFIMHDPDHFNVQLFNEMPFIEVIGNIYETPELLK